MTTRTTKAMLYQMKLTDEAVGDFIANDGQGIITIDDFYKLNNKFVEGLCQVLRSPRGTTGGLSNPELQCQQWLRQTYK